MNPRMKLDYFSIVNSDEFVMIHWELNGKGGHTICPTYVADKEMTNMERLGYSIIDIEVCEP
jgi:hypothetical protein